MGDSARQSRGSHLTQWNFPSTLECPCDSKMTFRQQTKRYCLAISSVMTLCIPSLLCSQVQGRQGLRSVPSDRGPAGPHLPSAGHGSLHAGLRVLQAVPCVVAGAGGPLRGQRAHQHRADLWRAHPRAPLHHQVPGVLAKPLGPRVQEHARLLHHRWVGGKGTHRSECECLCVCWGVIRRVVIITWLISDYAWACLFISMIAMIGQAYWV